jgi:hypothetical protein
MAAPGVTRTTHAGWTPVPLAVPSREKPFAFPVKKLTAKFKGPHPACAAPGKRHRCARPAQTA